MPERISLKHQQEKVRESELRFCFLSPIKLDFIFRLFILKKNLSLESLKTTAQECRVVSNERGHSDQFQ